MKLSEKLDELAGANSSWTASAAAAFLDAMELAKEYEAETEKRIAELEANHHRLCEALGMHDFCEGQGPVYADAKSVLSEVTSLRDRISDLEAEALAAWDTEDPVVEELRKRIAELEPQVRTRKATAMWRNPPSIYAEDNEAAKRGET